MSEKKTILEYRLIAILELLPVPISITFLAGELLYRWEIVSLGVEGRTHTFEDAVFKALTAALTPREGTRPVAQE